MTRIAIEKALSELNDLQRTCDKFEDKAYDLFQAGNIKKSDFYDHKADRVGDKIDGYVSCLRSLCLNVWRNGSTGEWLIPEDDVIKAC